MIELNPESVRNIINLAREFQSEASMEDEEPPVALDDDGAWEHLSDWHGDERYEELKFVIEDLDPDQQQTLVALMWLGRGDYDIEEWDDALTTAAESEGVATADYLIATPLLADYLEEGLRQHGYDAE